MQGDSKTPLSLLAIPAHTLRASVQFRQNKQIKFRGRRIAGTRAVSRTIRPFCRIGALTVNLFGIQNRRSARSLALIMLASWRCLPRDGIGPQVPSDAGI